MTLMMAVPIQEGDLELFGDDPYRSARSWHDAWMKSEAQLEAARKVVEAAQAYLDDILRLDNVNEDHLIQIIDAGATQWDLEEALSEFRGKQS